MADIPSSIKRTSNTRGRTVCESHMGSSLALAADAYNTYEAGLAADETKTWTVRAINSFFDGSNFFILSEAYYPERNTDPTGQVPIPSGGGGE